MADIGVKVKMARIRVRLWLHERSFALRKWLGKVLTKVGLHLIRLAGRVSPEPEPVPQSRHAYRPASRHGWHGSSRRGR
jgi:hypothetical protein